MILWNQHDYDHVFFITLSQLTSCLSRMDASKWSMIVFWNEGSSVRKIGTPDVGLDYTDQPVPSDPSGPPPLPLQGETPPGVPPGYQDPYVPDQPPEDGGDPSGSGPSHPPGGAPQVSIHHNPDIDSDEELPLDMTGHDDYPPPPPGGVQIGGNTVPIVPDDADEELLMDVSGSPGPPPDTPGSGAIAPIPGPSLPPPQVMYPYGPGSPGPGGGGGALLGFNT